MNNFHEIFSYWYIKIIFGIIISLFQPVYISVSIVFIMIVIDTVTGVISSIFMKRFNSKNLKKAIKKLLLYSTCLVTIRLVEVGALEEWNINALSQITSGFLIMTEAVSIIENLALMGLPIPKGFINIIFKEMRMGILGDFIKAHQAQEQELKDIEDILNYQVPSIHNEKLRKLLTVEIEAWIMCIKEISNYFSDIRDNDNELIYYKVATIVNTAFDDMSTSFKALKLDSCECTDRFREFQKVRLASWHEEIKSICYSLESIKKKKTQIIRKIIILIYETILDAQKCSFS